MHTVTNWLDSLSGPVVYAVVGALVYFEDALFFGFVLPGETAAVVGGVLAGQGRVSIGWLALVVVCAAIIGDSTGYEIGRRVGPPVLDTRLLRRHADRVRNAQSLIRRRGPAAVFFGRYIAFFRAMMPALAGISRMPYGRFLLYNALGGLTWGVCFTLLGYFAGAAYTRIEGLVGRSLALAVAVFVVLVLAVWQVRRRRRTRRPLRGSPGGPHRERGVRDAEQAQKSGDRPEGE
jgi:membrane protein DedA with SNARE-associated domain